MDRKKTHRSKMMSISLALVLAVSVLLVGIVSENALAGTMYPAGGKGPRAVTEEKFQFVIGGAANKTFDLPAGNQWEVSWGDGRVENNNGAAISHLFTQDTSTITIKPAGSTDAWLSSIALNGHNWTSAFRLIRTVNSPITPLMSRTAAQVTASATTQAPNNEWGSVFSNIPNFNMGPNFTFDQAAWQNVTHVGDHFAENMFAASSLSFNMNQVFNLPQNLTEAGDFFGAYMFAEVQWGAPMNQGFNLPQKLTKVGKRFAAAMFANGGGHTFAMNDVFNLPQNLTQENAGFALAMFGGFQGNRFKMNQVFNLPPKLTTASDNFGSSLFEGCQGTDFQMNRVFNLPPKLVNVGKYFASDMFLGCDGNAFKMSEAFNVPRNITAMDRGFIGGAFANSKVEINAAFTIPANMTTLGQESFKKTFMGMQTVQTRTIASIIGENPTPADRRETFSGGNGMFLDWSNRPENWGCGGGANGTGIAISFFQNTDAEDMNHYVAYETAHSNITPGRTIALPTPTLPDKQFLGWSTQRNGALVPANFTVPLGATQVTLYAKWVGITTITYNGNGNTAGTAPGQDTAMYGSSYTVQGAGTLVKTGYTFDGWNTEANGSGTALQPGVVTWSKTEPALTLYAQWKSQGGSTGTTPKPPATTPTPDPAKPPLSKVISIAASQKTIYIQSGKTVKLPYVPYTDNAGKQTLTWQTTKPKLAAVKKLKKKTGKLTVAGIPTGKAITKAATLTIKTGKKQKGTAKITLKAQSGKKLVLTIKVVKKAKKVVQKSLRIKGLPKVKKGKATITLAKAKKLKPLKAAFTKKATGAIVTWKTNKSAIATIAPDGKITVKRKGTITITLKVGGKSTKIKLKIK